MEVGNCYIAVAGGKDRVRTLKLIRDHIKPHHQVFVGVVAPIDPRAEASRGVCDRIVKAAEYIPVKQLGTTDDCGFCSFSDDTSTSRKRAFGKIRNRVAGAVLAVETLRGSS